MFARIREPVHGQFVVRSVRPLDHGDSSNVSTQSLQLTGQLVSAAGPGALVTVDHLFDAALPPPVAGTAFPAVWDSRDASRHRVTFPSASYQQVEKARAQRARALGIDPATLPAYRQPDAGKGWRQRAAQAIFWETNAAPLPTGVTPVQVPEADRLKIHGERGTAVVTAIDFLRPVPGTLPSKEASVANVALRVTRADGSTYDALGRFGFKTTARRAALGKVGAEIPVLLDPADPSRVTMDFSRLPVLEDG